MRNNVCFDRQGAAMTRGCELYEGFTKQCLAQGYFPNPIIQYLAHS